jgi:predicted nucleic acid-binding protein
VSLYLDASAIAPLFIEEGRSSLVSGFLASQTNTLAVSDFAVAEMASVLSRLVRMNMLTAKDAHERLEDFDYWRAGATTEIDLQAADARAANAIVRRFDLKLRTPDAVHAAICRRTGATLVTLDHRLAGAAGELGIACHIAHLP